MRGAAQDALHPAHAGRPPTGQLAQQARQRAVELLTELSRIRLRRNGIGPHDDVRAGREERRAAPPRGPAAGAWCGCGRRLRPRPWRRRNRPAAGVPHARRPGWRGPRSAWSRLGLPRTPAGCREVRTRTGAGAPRAARGRPQAESSERPLARRAERMARPARVRMRRRKPWVLARRRLFGWKVRLLTRFSVTGQARVAC